MAWNHCQPETVLRFAASAKTVRVATQSKVCDPPRIGRSQGRCLNGQYSRVSRDRTGVHPGLAVRPRTPGPHPLSGGFNETALESHLIRGLLVVQINWSLHAPSCRGFVPPKDSAAEFLLDTSRLPFYKFRSSQSRISVNVRPFSQYL